MAECAASLNEDLMVGRSIPAVAQGYLNFPAQKDERHQEQIHSPGVVRWNVELQVKMGYLSNGGGSNNFDVKRFWVR